MGEFSVVTPSRVGHEDAMRTATPLIVEGAFLQGRDAHELASAGKWRLSHVILPRSESEVKPDADVRDVVLEELSVW